MYNFTFHRPTTVRQAAGLLTRNPEAKLLAGGHSLTPVMKQRLASPSALIDLSQVEGIVGVDQKGRSIVIGVMAPITIERPFCSTPTMPSTCDKSMSALGLA